MQKITGCGILRHLFPKDEAKDVSSIVIQI